MTDGHWFSLLLDGANIQASKTNEGKKRTEKSFPPAIDTCRRAALSYLEQVDKACLQLCGCTAWRRLGLSQHSGLWHCVSVSIALDLGTVMNLAMSPLSSAGTCPLAPVTNLTPLELKDIISGYGRRSLGAARIGEDYSQPPPGVSDVFASLASDHTKFAYRFIVFGEISGQPEFCRGWPGRTLLSLVCPNWFTSGWPRDLFEEEFSNQILAMRYVSVLDCQQDEIVGKEPKLGQWANDRSLKLEIRPTIHTEYILPNGHYDATSPSTKDFPLCAGDTILAECTLHRFEFEHCPVRHWRGYSLVANRVQRLEIADCNDEASPASSATLEGDL